MIKQNMVRGVESRESFLKITFKMCFFGSFYIYGKVAKTLQRFPVHPSRVTSNHSSLVSTKTRTDVGAMLSGNLQAGFRFARPSTQAPARLREPIQFRYHVAFHREGGFCGLYF